jgi:glycogen phosphorylase
MNVAYLCLELAIKPEIKSYSGGLGILAGDTIKSYADLNIDGVAVTLLYKNGYFKQSIDTNTGAQIEANDEWDYAKLLTLTDKKFNINIENRNVTVQIWKYEIVGVKGHIVPVYFLDTNLQDNNFEDQAICFNLYSKYEHTRLKQEILIGVGGVKALQALGYGIMDKYHLNESHATFAIPYLQLLLNSQEQAKNKIVFTTHTPLEHGHKKYLFETLRPQLTQKVEIHTNNRHSEHSEESHTLGLETNQISSNHGTGSFPSVKMTTIFKSIYDQLLETNDNKNELNMTRYCLENSCYSNAVARKHAEIMHRLFPGFEIDYITNGIHTNTWISDSVAQVFDQELPDWKTDSSVLRNALNISESQIKSAHDINKQKLFEYIATKCNKTFDPLKFTIGFARRVDSYKRQNFVFTDMIRLEAISKKFGGLQFVFAGKAYPDTADQDSTLAQVYKLSQRTNLNIDIVYIPNYDMEVGKLMTSGVDIWLNNPLRPLEASGTSGMKAALNGVPNFSVVDGWWVEGWVENETGWSIGDEGSHIGDEGYELNELYNKLENVILPTYFYDTKKWYEIMRQTIAINASHFNTQRMVLEYLEKGYLK